MILQYKGNISKLPLFFDLGRLTFNEVQKKNNTQQTKGMNERHIEVHADTREPSSHGHYETMKHHQQGSVKTMKLFWKQQIIIKGCTEIF